MENRYVWKAILIGLVLCGLWFTGCSQQEGEAEKAGQKIDQTIEEAAQTMKDTKEEAVDAAKDLAEDVKDLTNKE